jgi:hypothetical protein
MLRLESERIVRWTEDGQAFQILDKDAMTLHVLPRYFKNKNFASFQRQLNYFGFRKWSKARSAYPTYSREHFTRDDYDAMSLVKRQSKKSRKRKASSSSVSEDGTFCSKRPTLLESQWSSKDNDNCKRILPKSFSSSSMDSTSDSDSLDSSSLYNYPIVPLNRIDPVAPVPPVVPFVTVPQLEVLVNQSILHRPIPVISPNRKVPSGFKLPSLHELPLANSGCIIAPMNAPAYRPQWLSGW